MSPRVSMTISYAPAGQSRTLRACESGSETDHPEAKRERLRDSARQLGGLVREIAHLIVANKSHIHCKYLLLLRYSTWRHQLDRCIRAGSDTRPELRKRTRLEQKDGLGRTTDQKVGDSNSSGCTK